MAQDNTSIPDDQQEDLDDLSLEDNWYYGATLWSTDWTTETITSQLQKGNIDYLQNFSDEMLGARRENAFLLNLFFGLACTSTNFG